jgi:hypothetical protein
MPSLDFIDATEVASYQGYAAPGSTDAADDSKRPRPSSRSIAASGLRSGAVWNADHQPDGLRIETLSRVTS